ncbi:MAG: GNAT family N-acetyltransferase [Nocardioidaceae bacterium]
MTDAGGEVDPEEQEFLRLYGPWQPWEVAEAVDALKGIDSPWWVAGGHAIEAFTGVGRPHDDIDVAMFVDDLPALRSHFAGRFDLWSAGGGALRPVTDRWPDLHEHAQQVWLREHAGAPWVADLVMSERRDGAWVFARDPDYAVPLGDATWVDDAGVRFLKPEIVLAYKAKLTRPKDDDDFAATWPLLDERARGWLRDVLTRLYPDHPWHHRMSAPAEPVGRAGRLVRLREATLADAALVDAWDKPAAQSQFNDFGLPPPDPLAEQLAHGRRMVGSTKGKLLVERCADGVLLGDVGWHQVSYGPNPESKAVNIGISLVREVRGQGYGAEAQRLLAALLFDLYRDVVRVEASTDVENLPEQRALEKAGFTRDGVIRQAQFRRGGYHDLVVYSVIRDDLPRG